MLYHYRLVRSYLCYVPIVKILLTLILISFSSCRVTKSVWDSSYNETFRQFLISQDGRMVVFVGSKYHYIFSDNTSILESILLWPGRRNLFINTEKSRIDLDRSNEVFGEIVVESYFNRMPPEDFEFLRGIGFRSSDKYSPLRITLMMKGKRYLPRSDLGYNLPELQRSYVLPIHYQGGALENIGKIALTPITVAADSTLLIGQILLAPFRGQ